MNEILSDSSSSIGKATVDEEEEWRGFKSEKLVIIEKDTNRKRPTKYMEPCPEIDRILNASRMRSHLNTLILNGNISSTCHYKKTAYIISNTCSFDAVIVGIVVAYNDYPTYKVILEQTSNDFLMMANMIALYGRSKEIYVARLKLLLNCFKVEGDIPAVKYIDAVCNVTKIIYNFLNTAPSSVQYIECSKNCTNKKILPSSSIILNNKHLSGFPHITQLLLNYIKKKSEPCYNKECKGFKTTYRILQNHLFIEADYLYGNEGNDKKLTDFPEQINIENTE